MKINYRSWTGKSNYKFSLLIKETILLRKYGYYRDPQLTKKQRKVTMWFLGPNQYTCSESPISFQEILWKKDWKDCKNQSTRVAEERWYLLDCTHEISTMRLPKQGMENNNVSQYANMYTEDFYKVLPLVKSYRKSMDA